jgi:hypothetical protein
MQFLKKLAALLGSFGFAAILLVFLTLLTWLGTLYQVDHGLLETQKRYFDSVFLIHWMPIAVPLPSTDGGLHMVFHSLFSVPIPLPGVYLLLALLLLNLVIGGIVRMRWDKARLGILVAHLGIVLMLVAGFVKYRFSFEGNLMLWPHQQKNWFESFYDWELAIREAVPEGKVVEHRVQSTAWDGAISKSPIRLTSDVLPFDVVAVKWLKNCVAVPKGPMFNGDTPTIDGYVLMEQPVDKDAEHNVAGLQATLLDHATGNQTDALFWGMETQPFTYSSGGKQWFLTLRHKRWTLPFTVRLDKFTFEMHPHTDEPALFRSDVTKIEGSDEQPVKISMNEPLRQAGYVLFQASYGPSDAPPMAEHYSVFEVVNNPSDQWPKWSCYIIAVGLLYHFAMKLLRYVKSENRLARAHVAAVEPVVSAAAAPPHANSSAHEPLAAGGKKK